MIFLDTSVLIRYFTGDDPHKARQCEDLFHQARSGRTTLFLTHLAIAETIWVLSRQYRIPKLPLVEGLRRLLNTRNVVCDDAPLILAALALFESKPISFIDAYHATFLPDRGITEFCSYDADFDQLSGIKRREP